MAHGCDLLLRAAGPDADMRRHGVTACTGDEGTRPTGTTTGKRLGRVLGFNSYRCASGLLALLNLFCAAACTPFHSYLKVSVVLQRGHQSSSCILVETGVPPAMVLLKPPNVNP